MKLSEKLLFPLMITCLALASEQAFAARDYLVELVVFSNLRGAGEEYWPNVDPPLNAEKMNRALLPSEIIPLDARSGEIRELEESTFRTYVERIRRDSSKQILLEAHWVQQVNAPESTTIARITNARDRDELPGSAPDQVNPGSASKKPLAMISPADTLARSAPPELDGFVNFFLDGYYALETDLRYTPPYRPSILDDNPNSGTATYRIHEQRKMKSGELNYYDHPKFGMVLLVTPVNSLAEQPGNKGQQESGQVKDTL